MKAIPSQVAADRSANIFTKIFKGNPLLLLAYGFTFLERYKILNSLALTCTLVIADINNIFFLVQW